MTTTVLVVGLAAISIVASAIAPDALIRLALLPSEVFNGQVWRVVTWPLYNNPSLWTVITLAIFYLFGRELERLMGRVRFAWYLAVLAVVPGLVATALDLSAAGLRFIELGCFVAYVVLYPQARSFFNIPLWVMGAVFIGIEALALIQVRDSRGLVFLFVVCATAVLMLSFFGLADHISWLPNVRLPKSGSKPSRSKPASSKTKKRKLKAVPTPPIDVYRPPSPRPGDGLRQAEIDVLLDKIAEHGIDSLTAEERRRLDEASRRLRDEKG